MVEIMLPEEQSPKTESYATKVFNESSVGTVSTLSRTTNLKRKVFQVIALVICLVGFLYQSGQFLAVAFQYPTTVDIDIYRPNKLQVPGYTFCDNSGINKRIFCEKFPDRCEVPSEKLCKQFEFYCGNNKSLVPKKEYYNLNVMMTLEEMIELNVKPDEFVRLVDSPTEENITGPHLRKKDVGHPSYICYSLYDRVNSSKSPVTVHKTDMFIEAVNEFTFHVRSDEMFLPGNRGGVLFSIHSPYEAVNPFENGIFLKPGRNYIIFVSMEEELLLQKPYKTDCMNYTEMWEKRGYSGPQTQTMCSQECLIDISMSCFNCVVPMLLYPTNKRICLPDEMDVEKCPQDLEEKFEKCRMKCKNDCRRTKYTYIVQERFSANLAKDIESADDIFTKIGVEIILEGDEIVVLKHSPKYMTVEIFSNIGGFIGCWLGMSLLEIADIFEGFFRILHHSFKKIKSPKDTKITL